MQAPAAAHAGFTFSRTFPKQQTMNLGTGQDWDQVVIRRKVPSAKEGKDEAAVNAVGGSGPAGARAMQ